MAVSWDVNLGPVLVVDLGALDIWRSKDGSIVKVSVDGRLLGVAFVRDTASDADAVFEALDEIAGTALVEVDAPTGPGRVKARIGWLNPFTSSIAVGRAEAGMVFADHRKILMDEPCELSSMGFDQAGRRVLRIQGRNLPLSDPLDMRQVTRVLAAHE